MTKDARQAARLSPESENRPGWWRLLLAAVGLLPAPARPFDHDEWVAGAQADLAALEANYGAVILSEALNHFLNRAWYARLAEASGERMASFEQEMAELEALVRESNRLRRQEDQREID